MGRRLSWENGLSNHAVVSNGTTKPYRVFMRTPSFANLMSIPAMIEGRVLADSIASMGSIDLVLGDVDR